MTLNAVLAIAIALLAGITVFAVVMGFFANSKKLIHEKQMNELIENLTKSEIESDRQESDLPNPKSWTGYWYRLGAAAGIEQPSPNRLGLMAAGIAAVTFFIGTFAWPREILVGIAFAVGSLVIFRMVLSRRGNKRLTKIDNQLPALLAGMRANLSANMTPQQAILSQVGEIPSPLGDELLTLKADLDVNIPLDIALDNFAKRVPSSELHFLASSMRIAISQGANLDDLLKTLQGILTDRAKIRDKLATAVAQAQPAVIITVLAIPLGLLFSYTSDERNREFWMSLPGLIAFGVIGVLYAAALWMSNKQIQKVKDA